MIFLSDNGPNPNWKGDIKLPAGYGQTLPLRGAKGSTFEGGIRTPSFIYGGYLENNCINNGGEYNDMVHISDWFMIINGMIGNGDYKDIMNDVDGINLWPSICNNDENVQRKIIKHFEMIDVNEKEQGFKASYIRTNEWKLLINSSLSFVEIPSNKYWVDYDDSFTTKPPSEKYQNMVNPDLFQSNCYDEYLLSDNNDDTMFEYDEIMLFKISDDNIEACNVAKENPKIVRRLMNKLFSDDNINEYIKWNSDPIRMSKQGALAQIESYDCDYKKSYHLSWQELDGYSDEEQVNDLSWNEIFQSMIDRVDACELSKRQSVDLSLYQLANKGIIRAVIVLVAILSLTSYLWTTSKLFNNAWKNICKRNKREKQRNMDIDEHTTLLSGV